VFVEKKLSTKRLGFGVPQTEHPPLRILQLPLNGTWPMEQPQPIGKTTKALHYTWSVVCWRERFLGSSGATSNPTQNTERKEKLHCKYSLRSPHKSWPISARILAKNKRLVATKSKRQAGNLLSFMFQDFDLSSKQGDGTKLQTMEQTERFKNTQLLQSDSFNLKV